MQIQYMKPIPAGTKPKVLLLGNGVHKVFHELGFADLLRKIAKKSFEQEDWDYLIDAVPFPLMAVIASNDTLGTRMKEIGTAMCEQEIPQDEIELLRTIAEKQIDAILTTDYTYELEYALIKDFKCGVNGRCKYRYSTCKEKTHKDEPVKGKSTKGKPKKKIQALHTYMGMTDQSVPPIWHIHGEASKPDSMILGHYYYGNLIGYLREYVGEAIRRYEISERNGTDFYPHSWVDYFLFGDVTIIGQGMNLCEMDLWWLVNCKKRNGYGSITHYEPEFSMENKHLAEAYGVKMVTETIGDDGYEGYYRRLLEDKL